MDGQRLREISRPSSKPGAGPRRIGVVSSTYRIADLTFDADRQMLRRGADPIHLGPLTFRFLRALIDAAPNVVDHDELAAAVWDGRTISPETISQRVKLLRDAIGDDASDPRYVELVRGRGYRLIPEVRTESSEESGQGRGARAAMAGVALLLAAGVLVWQLAAPPTTPERPVSVAILPFADMSPGGDQAYLADGMAEEILNELSRTTPLRVIARTSSFSFKDRNDDVTAIAEKLDVSHVVEGSVRKSGDRIRVTVHLISAADGSRVWSESYDRALVDMLQLQDEIAGSVAAALEVKLLGRPTAALSAPQRVDPRAYDLYLRGRQRLRDFALADAESYLEDSLAIDPDFMPAYSSLGDVYVRGILDLDFPLEAYREKLRNLLDRGLERAPQDAGLIGLSGQVARYDGDIATAEERFRRALALEPANVVVRMVYAMLKGDQGYPLEARNIAQPGRESDPLNPLYFVGDWSAAMDLWDAEAALLATARYESVATPGDHAAYGLRGLTKLALLGDVAGGIRDWERAADIATRGATRSHTFPWVYFDLGDPDRGDAAQQIIQQLFPDEPRAVFTEAYRHLAAGEVARARDLMLPLFERREGFSASYEDAIVTRFAVDALIERGAAARAVEIIDGLAPKYASYRVRERVHPDEFSPAPFTVKSIYSSYPALYFPDYIRALRAAGNAAGADNMLNHLDAILEWRRERGLFVEERHVAEARALRGDTGGALDALEQAEQDRTIYHSWHVFLLHNPIFRDIRGQPRFAALIGRVREEIDRQRAELTAARTS